MSSGSGLLWLLGAAVALIVGLLIGAVVGISLWRHGARGRGPAVPTFFLVGPGIAAIALLALAWGLLRKGLGWPDVAPSAPTAGADEGDLEAILFACAVIGVCAWMAWRHLRDRRTSRQTPLVPIARVDGGRVRVEGFVEALGAPVRSPYTGLEGVAIRSTLQRVTDDGDETRRQTLADETIATTFVVRDTSGALTVVPDGATFLHPATLAWRDGRLQANAAARSMLSALGLGDGLGDVADVADGQRAAGGDAAFFARLQANQARRAREHRQRRDAPAALAPQEAAASDAHRQALAYLDSVGEAMAHVDPATTEFEERVVRVGDPIAVLGDAERGAGGQRSIGRRSSGTLFLATSSAALDRRLGRWKPIAGWLGGALVGLAWLVYELR